MPAFNTLRIFPSMAEVPRTALRAIYSRRELRSWDRPVRCMRTECRTPRLARLARRLPFAPPCQRQAADQHQCTPNQEPDVPIDPLVLRDGFVDMVDAEKLVIDHPFDQIEYTEAHEHRPKQHLSRPPEMRFVSGAPEHDQTKHDENVCAGVEQAIGKRVEPKVLNTVGGIAGAGRHMMPLEQLMQHDSIEGPSRAPAEYLRTLENGDAARPWSPSLSPLAPLTSGQAMCSPTPRVGYARS